MKLEVLRAATPTGAIDLRGARGLVAFVPETEAAWGGYVAALRAAFAARGRLRGPGSVVRGEAAAATVGTAAFEAQLGKVLARHSLRREEYAAVWLGTGPARVWVEAGVALLEGPEATGRLRQGDAEGMPGQGGQPSGAKVEAGWVGELLGEAKEEVERLTRLREGVGGMGARLAELREEAAIVQGDAEAAALAWARERQDAETRLLLYRDREREVRRRLEQISQAGSDAACGTCGRSLDDRTDAVLDARREEWESVVQDGKWWRRRRAQLEVKPGELRELEMRALSLNAEVEELGKELRRRRAAARELGAATRRLERLRALEGGLSGGTGSVEDSVPAGIGSEAAVDGSTAPDPREAAIQRPQPGRTSGESGRRRFRGAVHARVVTLTGGRLATGFPELYADWVGGRRPGGEAEAAIELAARITLAELAERAGVRLGSIVLPSGLERLSPEDLPRALAELVLLAKRIPLVMARATPETVAGAPESFDLLYRLETAGKGSRVRRQRLGLATIWLQGD